MTTQTRALPDLDEALDFEPRCTVGHDPTSTHEPCLAEAAWIAVRICCGRDSLWCDPHKSSFVASPDAFFCLYCHASPAEYSRIERIK